ncbi:unnamed protein product [Candidula unifasciata]|uniref:Tyrosine-protein kinase ephrin type A/B receptor-like domain-containing protein n=1 Tax=Candidula unifasciata TaxID=100452 RepID=A0A8S3YYL3_9EUPU|nr:unnamed protein product [Candidula unifasciata]
MVSRSLSLVLRVLFCALWATQFLEAFPNFCIFMPNLPLHGKFKITGSFIMRIKCVNRSTDIPLNALGDGGVLFCDPNKQKLTKLPNVYNPVCLEYKKPSLVQVGVRLSYTSDHCPAANPTISTLTQRQKTNLRTLRRSCGPDLVCLYTTPEVKCGNNYNFRQAGGSKQLDATFDIIANYFIARSTDFYQYVLDNIRKNSFAINQGINRTGIMWNLQGFKLVNADFTPWTASCHTYNLTSGTNLAVHGFASCRGCPEDTVYVSGGTCLSCPYDFYTGKPFAKNCEPCPGENTWGAERKTWIKRCYVRA